MLNDPVFKEVIQTLIDRSLQELRGAQVGDLTAQRAHGRIKALDEILGELKALEIDAQVTRNREKGNHHGR